MHNHKASKIGGCNRIYSSICLRIYSSCLYCNNPRIRKGPSRCLADPLIFIKLCMLRVCWESFSEHPILQRFKHPSSLLQADLSALSSDSMSTGSHTNVSAHVEAQSNMFSQGLLALPHDSSFAWLLAWRWHVSGLSGPPVPAESVQGCLWERSSRSTACLVHLGGCCDRAYDGSSKVAYNREIFLAA